MVTSYESDQADRKAVERLTEIYDEHKNVLFSFALSIVANRSDAEDVIQILFQKVWKD